MKYRIENNQRKIKEIILEKNTERITKKQYSERVKDILDKARLQIGIAPITNKDIEMEIKKLEDRNLFNKEATYLEKKQNTIQIITKRWIKKNLKITEEEWRQIKIKETRQASTESNIIYLKFENTKEITKITSK